MGSRPRVGTLFWFRTPSSRTPQRIALPSAPDLFPIRSFDLRNQSIDVRRTEFGSEFRHAPLPVADHNSQIFFGRRRGLFRAKGWPREMPSFGRLTMTLGAVRLKYGVRAQAVLRSLGQSGQQKSRKHGAIDTERLQYAPRQNSMTSLILFYRNGLLFEKLPARFNR